MALDSETKSVLSLLGFTPQEGVSGIWIKHYSLHSYKISVDINNELILYGDKISLGDKTTSNFKANENFVVLECVNKLLDKGYPPECINLEKDYPLGHKTKGKLDIRCKCCQ